MKRLFFFRSSTDKPVSENSTKAEVHEEGKKRDEYCSESLRKAVLKNQNYKYENQNLDNNSGLRRSRSFSSAAFLGNGTAHRDFTCLSDQSASPSSSCDSVKARQHRHSSRRSVRALTPERHQRGSRYREAGYESDNGLQDHLSFQASQAHRNFSGNCSLSSSNVSNEVLDLYIDGEQQIEKTRAMSKISSKERARTRSEKKPPRSHCTAPGSPTGSIMDKPRSHSFRGARGSQLYFSSRDWAETGVRQETPQELAKHVVERLCQTDISPRKNSKEYDSDVPITIEDIYNKSCNKYELLMPDGTDREFQTGDYPGFEDNEGVSFGANDEDETELNDKASLKDQVRFARLEISSRVQKLQNEKMEIQSVLEKELDRRSNDWSLKAERYQAEEKRLRDRVRELAEQNVSLQREVSSFRESETERRDMISFSERQINDLTSMLEAARGENRDLCQRIHDLQEKCEVAEEDRDCMRISFGEKEEECRDLHTCVTRLRRTCSEQEKTIDSLRGELLELVQKNHSAEKLDKHVRKLDVELIRLTGVEQALRREAESYKLEVDSLRHENIDLLNRLKGCGKEGGFLTYKLDQELSSRLQCLQTQGLSMIKDSTHLCSKLLESIKRIRQSAGMQDGAKVNSSSIAQLVIDSDVKVQGFKRGTESLMRSLQNITTVLHEKSSLIASECTGPHVTVSSEGRNSQDLTRCELKAETLLTSLLREKVYAKDLQVEQLQAEVASATRTSVLLKCEVQNALDSLSSVTHKMKEVELQMMKKEEKLNQLQMDLQESTKELTMVKDILPKVAGERDMMWEQVKHHTEKNMLLNSEVNMLKKKIEAQDEDLLFKEGQITILRDSLGNKSFDLLASPDDHRDFLLE